MTVSVRLLCVIAALFVIAPPSIVSAGKEPGEEAVLKRMEDAGKRLATLKADFRQEKIYSLFEEKKTFSGTIYFKKPGAMLWKYNPPERTEIYIRGGDVLMYIPDIKQVQKIPLARDRKTESLLIGFGNTAEEIKRNFSVKTSALQNGNHIVELTPRTEELSSHFQKLRLTLDSATWLPSKTERFEAGGDRTIFSFSNVETNIPLRGNFFEFSIPEGVEVVQY